LGWQTLRLKDVIAHPITDGPHLTPEFHYEGVPFLSVDGIQNGELQFEGCRFITEEDHLLFSQKVAPKRGDILLGKAASTGKIAQVKVDFEFSIWSPLALIRPDKCQITPTFLEYALKSPISQAQIDVLCTHNTQSNISMDDIPKLTFPIPSISEQQQIAAFLDWKTSQIDALIAKKQELLDKLKEKRLAVITQAVTKGLNPDAPMRDSGIACLGQVPAHWKTMPIKFALCEPITDGPHETPEIFDDGVPFLSAEAVKNDRLDFEKKRGYISLEDHERFSKKYKPKRGDVYMVKSGATTGNIARVETDADFNIWSPLAALRPDFDIATTDFIFYFMKSKPFFYSVEQGWSFGTQQNIGMGVIANLPMACPPVAEQKLITNLIERKVTKFDAMSTSCTEAITRLTEYRTALITAATTGKIDVRNWQAVETTA